MPLEEKAGDADPYVGQTLANCRIIEKIADGELGPIYRAEDQVRGVVALQIIPQEQLGKADRHVEGSFFKGTRPAQGRRGIRASSRLSGSTSAARTL